jgi:phage gp45-like
MSDGPVGNVFPDHIADLRAACMRGIVVALDDTGQMQTVDVQTHDGALRTGVEVYQPFGIATAPPVVGSVALLLAVGADPGDLVAIVLVTPAARMGGLDPGETVLYGMGGARVAIGSDGSVEVMSATSVTISAPDGVTVQGNVTINGSLNATGSVADSVRSMAADRALYDEHTHPGGASSPPAPQQ